ncbi:hypothetical protein NUW58_g5953 [Xylaria curta]|uniref:Uncharacterized protein n=1 Tax=Xylaria curta TaxID=42375 RepID=A0ACC1NZU8_9PEZI|nr:hypothetical protein NUW58_g5953 [Xylaria curta]
MQENQEPPNIALKQLSGRPGEETYRVETAFEVEATALDELCALNHPNLVKRIASFTRGSDHYFLFEWADGGNLREFWQTFGHDPAIRFSQKFVTDIVCQLQGLADAICALHNLKDSESWRHGDLKPENILRHLDPADHLALGVLRISDFGLAKRHNISTGHRSNASSSAYRTERYKPPETDTSRSEPQSRLYDIWSMGCIILEFVIWLLYGIDALERLHGDLEQGRGGDGTFFVLATDSRETHYQASLHPTVLRWFDHMFQDDECGPNTLLGDILRLVQQRLLVVDLPVQPQPPSPIPCEIIIKLPDTIPVIRRCRATALEFRDEMGQITSKMKTVPSYLPNNAAPKLRQGLPPQKPLDAKLTISVNPKTASGRYSTPTRLIDVGPPDSPTIRLRYTHRVKPGNYVALSHRWGDAAPHETFGATRAIIDELSQGFDLNKLPMNFQDAVKVTRELKIQFLWIDSICIIQDDSADWEAESRHMEQVFSSAYCVLAADSSECTSAGFLHPHSPRRFVALEYRDGNPFYVCESIDNFHGDVELGELNKRGWVLQERALARRTIHFTDSQMYWECGEGIRCETLTKMINLKSSILGDAHFPHNATNLENGGKINVHQSLYERYSRLAFTDIRDRPIAIIGLEDRLVRDFNTRGKYGILECFLHRSLLWKRGDDEIELRRIDLLEDRKIPSWSWLAYQGGISYMKIRSNNTEWDEILRTAFNYSAGYSTYTGDAEAFRKLEVYVVDYDVSKISIDNANFEMIFDGPTRQEHHKGQCVIVGKEILENSTGSQKHYVLLVSQKSPTTYERVGVGILSRDCIYWGASERLAQLV